ncbi:heme lyase CcmF/NrfE family subunit [Phyllobacterium sp. 0TCS1.6C]|uniref:heme lyase CcmF/NrfE family subunit n=1 Tax=unclassified Phyllobacterium TaxID=2638441 RepID=UPI0022641E63|nr:MULTISPECIES: heme lyase CcmF/NrfE family subunit [unclassified Phyllobacterium]MCX8281250.1 heme lyase CcmF/NrfE family subunit [Phyllobacterium sp. 0TCS1.6C]MCX8296094.1 heme lyase CcmF/NrfE family subunit [Phyllobacterium sp. 0TCS1.6A]
MMVELGHFALILALVLSLAQSVLPMLGARRNDERLMAVGTPAALTVLALVALAFAALTMANVLSDFSVKTVFENSHSQKPLLYKFTGVWGNHEGSMLLWVLILSFFTALVGLFGNNLPQTLKANVLGVQAWIGTAFLLFIVATSNPFARLEPAPIEGRDLNPILQDIGLAIHPPLLYLGYVGFSVCFSFAIAALVDGRIDAAWARWVRPWTLTAWIFLTGGIAMGSYWAYYELGWGGWWFWDPVENASFMPWLAGTALLHSALVMEKRSALKIWTVLLALLTFSLSLLGTFLVRSGVLTSVHTFATDPGRGLFILAILVIFIGGSLALFAWRAGTLAPGGLFQPISREGALVLNNLFLTTATATVLVGTLYPLLLEALTGEKISVGAPFFNLTFGPLMLPLLAAVPFGPLLAWKRGDLLAVGQRLMTAFLIALLVTGVVLYQTSASAVLAALGIGLAAWLMLGALTDLALKAGIGRGKTGAGVMLQRLAGLPRSVFGTALAHFGLGITLLGIVATTAFSTESVLVMRPGESIRAGGHTLRFEKIEPVKGPNFTEEQGHFTLLDDAGTPRSRFIAAKRYFPVREMQTTEAGITTFLFSQVYVALGETPAPDGAPDAGVVVRIWYKPLVTLIWLGAVAMMLGGICSLLDRRLRVGAPARRSLSSGGLPAKTAVAKTGAAKTAQASRSVQS